ncbi:hypothetical protein BpHYR1_021333, partial [Brachionus plicatilis]
TFLIAAVFDKPARSSIIKINSSNGYYGCLKCVQKGKNIPTERGFVITYPYDISNPDGPPRTEDLYNEHLEEQLITRRSKAIPHRFGIKANCSLNQLKYFNAVKNTNIDAMHNRCTLIKFETTILYFISATVN